ncbi:DUF6230 family protein [Actinomadura rubteroloni]|nr:DUF6230 family protein [Actinomadura rubteroloni]
MLQGSLPVWATLRGEQYIKLSITQITGYGRGSSPQLFRSMDGKSHPVLVAAVDDARIRGLCASSKVKAPFGTVVARFVVPPDGPVVRVRSLRMAIQDIEIADLADGALTLGRPGGGARDARPGSLPLDGRDLRLAVHAKVRWVTVEGMKASGMRLSTGTAVKECY